MRMMPAMSSVRRTMTEETQSGTMWRTRMRAAERTLQHGGGDEVAAGDRRRLGARDARIGRPGGERDRDHRVDDARPQRRREGEREHQPRERRGRCR